jgi:hypothetical protein
MRGALSRRFLKVLQAASGVERRLKKPQDSIFWQKPCRALLGADFGRTYFSGAIKRSEVSERLLRAGPQVLQH